MSRSAITSRQALNTLQNLLTNSEDFSGYTKTNCTVTANTVANPLDGALTASTMTDNTTNSNHAIVGTTIAFKAFENLTFSIYLKDVDRRYAGLWFDTGSVNMIAIFDLQTGTATFVQSTPIGAALSFVATIEAMGDGWYRCSATLIMSTNGNVAYRALMSSNGTLSSYAGNGSSVYIFGAQVTRSNWAGPYCRTTGSAISTPIRNKYTSRAALTSRAVIS